MGFFSKFRSKMGSPKFVPASEAEAWVGILGPCAAADGEISRSEMRALVDTLLRREVFSEVDGLGVYQKVMAIQQKLGNEKLIEGAVKKIAKENRNTVFCLAIDLVLSDGHLDAAEEEIIGYVAEKLEIDSEMSDKITEVLLIKNRGRMVTT